MQDQQHPQQPAPDFGEPWREIATWDELVTKDGTSSILYAASDMNEPYRSRAIACVNACVSMRDPAAEIQALRDAASCLALLVDHGHADDCLLLNRANAPCDCGVDQAEAALAKLKALA